MKNKCIVCGEVLTPVDPPEHMVINVPPSWFYAGTVYAKDSQHVLLRDCVYVESVSTSAWSLAMASPKEQAKIATGSHPMADGHVLRIDAITGAAPSVNDFTALSRSQKAKAVKELA